MKITIESIVAAGAPRGCWEEDFSALYPNGFYGEWTLDEQLRVIRSGLGCEFNWAVDHNIVPLLSMDGIYLRGADLRNAFFSGCSLVGSNMRGANLEGAEMEACDLRNSDLRNSNLRDADLINSDLRGANLLGANMRGTLLMCANLDGTKVKEYQLRRANLTDTTIS